MYCLIFVITNGSEKKNLPHLLGEPSMHVDLVLVDKKTDFAIQFARMKRKAQTRPAGRAFPVALAVRILPCGPAV